MRGSYTSGYDKSAGRFVPMTTTRIPFRQPMFGCQALDCRHGRVLLNMVDGTDTIRESLAVWDPITGDHMVLSNPHPASDPFGRFFVRWPASTTMRAAMAATLSKWCL